MRSAAVIVATADSDLCLSLLDVAAVEGEGDALA